MSSKKPKVIVVMPAYHAEKTIEKTFAEVPKGLVNEIILVDDAGGDKTIAIAKKLGITVYQHSHNLGYGGNQKTCYWEALKRNPDVVVMLHPANQYDGALVPFMTGFIKAGVVDIVLGSRIRRRTQ